jgi:hypothetical protein
VAAGPAKVGEYCPKLDDAMALVVAAAAMVPACAGCVNPAATASATDSDSSANLDWRYMGFLHSGQI